jgi:hypothetical protein
VIDPGGWQTQSIKVIWLLISLILGTTSDIDLNDDRLSIKNKYYKQIRV